MYDCLKEKGQTIRDLFRSRTIVRNFVHKFRCSFMSLGGNYNAGGYYAFRSKIAEFKSQNPQLVPESHHITATVNNAIRHLTHNTTSYA